MFYNRPGEALAVLDELIESVCTGPQIVFWTMGFMGLCVGILLGMALKAWGDKGGYVIWDVELGRTRRLLSEYRSDICSCEYIRKLRSLSS